MIINDYAPIVKAYIDPGTGSALFAVLIGLIGVVVYGIKGLFIKLKFGFGKNKDTDSETIPYAIYTDSKRYWNTFKPICDEFEKRNISVVYFTQSEDDPAFDMNYKYVKPSFIGTGNKGISKMNFLNADIVLSTTPSLDVYQWKRSKNVKWYVHIPHACNDLTMYRMFGIDYYDAILANGQFQIDQIRELEIIRNLEAKECELVGLTYFDQMFERLKHSEKIRNIKPVVLLAPSWGPSSLLNKYGSKLIDKLIDTGYQIIIRPHPQSFVSEKDLIDELSTKYKDIEWDRSNDNFNTLNKADILISDFSGVIFDFSFVFDKPIIYADVKFDDSIYDATWIEEKPWIFEVLPKIGFELNEENIESIKDVIDDSLNNIKYCENRKKAKREAWTNIGKSAENIVNYMTNKMKEINNG